MTILSLSLKTITHCLRHVDTHKQNINKIQINNIITAIFIEVKLNLPMTVFRF